MINYSIFIILLFNYFQTSVRYSFIVSLHSIYANLCELLLVLYKFPIPISRQKLFTVSEISEIANQKENYEQQLSAQLNQNTMQLNSSN